MSTKNTTVTPRGIFSKECEYAMKIMLYVAGQPFDKFVSGREIALNAMMPTEFVSGIISKLAVAGLLVTRRGPGGGVRLAKPRAQITLLDIIKVIDGTIVMDACIIGNAVCKEPFTCALHDSWEPVRRMIYAYFADITLAVIDK